MLHSAKHNRRTSALIVPAPGEAFISNERLQQFAPSTQAIHAHGSRSERYRYIATTEVISAMKSEGFFPTEVRQALARDTEKRGFTKHLIRFRRDEFVSHQEELPEVILVNSHDGSSAYQLLAGWFRIVCDNGLITADNDKGMNATKVYHKGNGTIESIIEASYTIVKETQEQGQLISEMKSVSLTPYEQHAFAQSAAMLRFEQEAIDAGIGDTLLRVIRPEDNRADLWTTFNRVQEHLLAGGMPVVNQGKVKKARAVNGIDGNVKLNTSLWALTKAMLGLKR
jgi:Domain of unknown function (DUF932)